MSLIQSRLQDIIYDRNWEDGKNSDSAFFLSMEMSWDWAKGKYKDLMHNLQDNIENSPEFVDKKVYLERCECVIDVVEAILLSDSNIKKDWFSTKWQENDYNFFKQHYQDWEFYGRKFGESYGKSFKIMESFHYLQSIVNDPVLLSNIQELKKLVTSTTKKDKKRLSNMWSDVHQLRNFVDYFERKNRFREEAKEMFLKRRKFKLAKKKVFIFDVKASGSQWFIDFLCPENDQLVVIVSHIDEENARNAVAHKRDDGSPAYFEGVFKDLANRRDAQWHKVELSLMDRTPDNVAKAKERIEKSWRVRYDSYGEFFRTIKFTETERE